MSILFLLIPLSVVLVAVIGVVLFWAVQSGQFDSIEAEGTRLLADDDSAESS